MKTSFNSVSHEYRVTVEVDTDPINPITDYIAIGKMYCWHRHYILGTDQPRMDPRDFIMELAREKVAHNYPEALLESNAWKIIRKHYVIKPLYLYDHGGISMSTSTFLDKWDSGQVGWFVIDMDEVSKEWKTDMKAHAEKYIEAVVQEYDDYLTGSVYGFVVSRRPLDSDDEDDWEDVDSCWGFYGHDEDTNGMADAISEEHYLKQDIEELNREEQKQVLQFSLALEST